MHTNIRLVLALVFASSLGFGLAACQTGDAEKAKACTPSESVSDCETCCKAAGFSGFAFTTQLDGNLCECA